MSFFKLGSVLCNLSHTVGSPPLRDGLAVSSVQWTSFAQPCEVERGHSRMQSCEKAKKRVKIPKFIISSQHFHSIHVYSGAMIRFERKIRYAKCTHR